MIDAGSVLKRFIVFEGIDGAGTTTQARALARRLQAAGPAVWSTSEPTERPVGRLVRRVLAGEISVSPETVAHLFAADRSDHLSSQRGICARLEAGEIVVCDRYKYSSLAYQGIDVDPGLVGLLNARFPDPGLVFFLDLPADVGDRRLAHRARREIYENVAFQEKVRERYRTVLAEAGGSSRVVTLDGSLPPSAIAEKIWETIVDSSIL